MAITINQLSFANQIAANDQFPIYQTANGTGRRISMNAIMEYVQANFVSGGITPEGEEIVIASPAVNGFNISLPLSSSSFWAIINPTGPFAAGTLTLPPVGSLVDGQHVIVNSTQPVTSFTISSAGALFGIVPNTLGTGGFFRLQYSLGLNTWFRVG